ncbi:hypothetical protein ACHAXN_000629 [Cyclotella atomus]
MQRVFMRPSFSAVVPLAISSVQSFAFNRNPTKVGRRSTERFMSNAAAGNYPRPIHPGGFSLPPLVEDLIPIVTECKYDNGKDLVIQTNLLLVKPSDMDELWEWYAYTRHQTKCDPSWGRVWPTALSMARFIQNSFHSNVVGAHDVDLVNQAIGALKSSSHVVELGCGLGVAGLAFASIVTSLDGKSELAHKRTVTYLDREPFALHCAMSSAQLANLQSAPLEVTEADREADSSNASLVTVRASMDDWTALNETNKVDSKPQIKNIGYNDLCLFGSGYRNQDTTILASDILYEPHSMKTLAIKIKNLLNPNIGGFALISDPEEERTEGCRDNFVSSVKELGGDIAILPLPVPQGRAQMMESDIDINGSLASTVLIVVHFPALKNVATR